MVFKYCNKRRKYTIPVEAKGEDRRKLILHDGFSEYKELLGIKNAKDTENMKDEGG